MAPLLEIGLTDLPKSGCAMAHPAHPETTGLLSYWNTDPFYEILSIFCMDILDQFTPCSLSHRSLQECKQFSTHTSSKKPTYTLQLLIFARKIPKLHYLALKKGKRLQSLTRTFKRRSHSKLFFQK